MGSSDYSRFAATRKVSTSWTAKPSEPTVGPAFEGAVRGAGCFSGSSPAHLFVFELLLRARHGQCLLDTDELFDLGPGQ
jgi:hypothetical protein